MIDNEQILRTMQKHYPDVLAIYLYGSRAGGEEASESDVDLAVLFSPLQAKQVGSLAMSDLHGELEIALGAQVDLVNMALTDTVLQKEIILKGQRIFCADPVRVDEFEMVALSLYQQLNLERAGILAEAIKSGRLHAV